MFQHAAARRRLLVGVKTDKLKALFQHTAARRRLQVENMIRCAFRENNNYGVTRTYPFSRFSWSKLGEEIHDNISEIASIVWGQIDIQSELSIPRIQQLSVTVQK